jgi:predicted kinase
VAELARHAGVPFLGLWCHVPEEEARRRIRGRTGDVSDADEVILNSQLARGAGPMAWPTLDGRGTPGDVLARAVDLTAPLHR